MKINMTIEEAKQALLKEAKQIRKELNIGGDQLKVNCNVKQMANNEFTIYSRDLDQHEQAIMAIGSKFGTYIDTENGGQFGHRLRFQFKIEKPKEEPAPIQTPATPPIREESDQTFKKMPQKLFDALNEARVEMRVRYDLGPQVVQFIHERCHSEQFVVVLHDTDQQHGADMLETFRHLGQIVKITKYDTCVEYVFRPHEAPYQRPAIVMDLTERPCPQDIKEAKENATESAPNPLAQAKKDIMKFADKLRKSHGIAGSDFRIICTDMHIAIGEFILFMKGGQDYEHLRTEFDQFGRCYKTESAGQGATRFRFYFKNTSMYNG